MAGISRRGLITAGPGGGDDAQGFEPAVLPPTVPGVHYRFYAGSTLEPFATSPTATVAKVYAGNGRAYAVPSTGGAYLALAIDVPNGSTPAEISYLV